MRSGSSPGSLKKMCYYKKLGNKETVLVVPCGTTLSLSFLKKGRTEHLPAIGYPESKCADVTSRERLVNTRGRPAGREQPTPVPLLTTAQQRSGDSLSLGLPLVTAVI